MATGDERGIGIDRVMLALQLVGRCGDAGEFGDADRIAVRSRPWAWPG
jgi:hypothetical protein